MTYICPIINVSAMDKEIEKADENWKFCGLSIEHVREIIRLILDGKETNIEDIELTIHVLEPNRYTAYKGERLTINIPIKLNPMDDEFFKYGYEIMIYDNGHIVYENGMGSSIGLNNPLEIYKILVDNFKVVE